VDQDLIEKQILLLKKRFENNKIVRETVQWNNIEAKLKANPKKCKALSAMESSGGEPNVVFYDLENDKYWFFDCAIESPLGRRSLCYDDEALDKRKQNKPKNSALNLATQMEVEILNEDQYSFLQNLGNFDTKTSSWLKTNDSVRKLGGAIFGDKRYSRMFIYHNGAESYYASRGFRACLKV
jgi:hypothetical protein